MVRLGRHAAGSERRVGLALFAEQVGAGVADRAAARLGVRLDEREVHRLDPRRLGVEPAVADRLTLDRGVGHVGDGVLRLADGFFFALDARFAAGGAYQASKAKGRAENAQGVSLESHDLVLFLFDVLGDHQGLPTRSLMSSSRDSLMMA